MVQSRKRPVSDVTHDPASLIGVRVGVWWSADATYYSATVIDYNPLEETHLVRYDDTIQEWLSLRNETFTWLAPRSASAGADAARREALCQCGATNVPLCPPPPPRLPPTVQHPPTGLGAVGRTLSIWSPVDGTMHHGEVIACGKGGHLHVLYDDGEDEVMDAAREVAQWDEDAPTRPAPCGPTGRAAIGWRVALHDATAMRYCTGVVAAFYPSNNTHRIKFDDDEWKRFATVSFAAQPARAIKWLFPPAIAAAPTASDAMGSVGSQPSPCSSQQTHLAVQGEHYAVRQLQRLPSRWGQVPALHGPLTVKIACCQGMQPGNDVQSDAKCVDSSKNCVYE